MSVDNMDNCAVCGSLCASDDDRGVVCWDCEDRYFLSYVIVVEEEE